MKSFLYKIVLIFYLLNSTFSYAGIDSGSIFTNIKSISDVAAVAVDETSATAFTITAGKSYIGFQNTGDYDVWYGGSTVNPATKRGWKLVPGAGFTFANTTASFVVYFKSDTDASTISIIEG